MTVAYTLERWPAAAQVFLQHRMACLGCCLSSFDTLADAARNYQLAPQDFQQELEQAINPQLSQPHSIPRSFPMTDTTPRCLVCQQSSQEVPLLALSYQDRSYWICPQHFPILIHKPEQLVGLLPGAENLQPHEHED